MTTQPIRNKNQVRALADYYLSKGQIRNQVIIILGVHTALCISDLLRLTWDDVYDFELGRIRACFSITEKKTHKTKTIALNKAAKSALAILALQSAKRGHFTQNPESHQPYSSLQADSCRRRSTSI